MWFAALHESGSGTMLTASTNVRYCVVIIRWRMTLGSSLRASSPQRIIDGSAAALRISKRFRRDVRIDAARLLIEAARRHYHTRGDERRRECMHKSLRGYRIEGNCGVSDRNPAVPGGAR